jgi:hypothetical protein
MTRREVQELLAICEQADDQDTGTLDAFREAATVGVVAELCRSLLWRQKLLADAEEICRIQAAQIDAQGDSGAMSPRPQPVLLSSPAKVFATNFPDVQGRCSACGLTTLFLGAGGHVTCSWAECPNPGAADELLKGPSA